VCAVRGRGGADRRESEQGNGGVFLYYGMKAVQLTEMSNRVWKRTAEYNLILSERKRLGL
jgi:hypothetical protein